MKAVPNFASPLFCRNALRARLSDRVVDINPLAANAAIVLMHKPFIKTVSFSVGSSRAKCGLSSESHIVEGSLSTRRPYSDKNAREAGNTPREARKGRVSAPAAVTMMASLRFCRMVRLKLAQKKMSARGTSFCHKVTGSGKFASMSFKLSAGTWCRILNLQTPILSAHKELQESFSVHD